MFYTRGESGAVLFEGREDLSGTELHNFLQGAWRKKIRLGGRVEKFQTQLYQEGEAAFSWNFVRRIRRIEDHWANVHAWSNGKTARLFLSGPQSAEVLEKANRSFYRKLPRRVQYEIKERKRKSTRARLEKKRRQREMRLLRWASNPVPRQPKKRKVFIAAPISLERNEKLTPQFRKQKIFWSEALTAIVAIFEIRRNEKRSARELAARELWDSLERSGYKFAQYKRRGFTLRVDFVDGRWRGDITCLTISCTKDNQHPTYQRMRDHLKDLLIGLPEKEQAYRRERIRISGLRRVA